jgi:Domain of unknown function (DUF1841)
MSEKTLGLSEHAARDIALKYHPEWRRAMKKGGLPAQLIGDNGEFINQELHLTIHTIVERQLASDAPQGVVAIARQLEQLGLSQHDIRHEIGRAVASQLWYLLQEGSVFDEPRYLAELQALVESHRRPS